MSIAEGTYKPPVIDLTISGFQFTGGTPTLERISQFAGAAIGSAVVVYANRYAKDVTAQAGKRATITLGGTLIFRGEIGDGPFDIAEDEDSLRLMLFDDKWGMQSRVVGQPGIGSVDAGVSGFPDVGFDVCFNRDGRPNKNPSALNFNCGSTAVYWTLKTALQFLFAYYVASDVARLDPAVLGTAYDLEPTDLNLRGANALAAVDQVVALTGQTWALWPNSGGYSDFKPVVPGAGTARTLRLFKPRNSDRSSRADEYTPSRYSAGESMLNVRDYHIVVSRPIVRETLFSTANGLLVKKADFTDREYYLRYETDVTQYATIGCGKALSAGAAPKPWQNELITRLNDARNGHHTAAGLATSPRKWDNPRAPIPVWIATDGNVDNKQLVTDGIRIDEKNGAIEFKELVTVWEETGGTWFKVQKNLNGKTNLAVWATVAVEDPLPEYAETDEAIFTRRNVELIESRLEPLRRYNSWLPNLASSDRNAHSAIAATEEKYHDITARLQALADAAAASSPNIERPLSFFFPWLPLFRLGDRIALSGRTMPVSGNEVVIEITYNGDDQECEVKASDVVGTVNPEQFVQERV